MGMSMREIGPMAGLMVRANWLKLMTHCKFLIIQLVAIMVLGRITSKPALVKKFGRMGYFIEESTKMDSKRARAPWSIQTLVNIMETGNTTRCMVMGPIPGQTAESTRVSGRKTICMAKVTF
jgi:hypothetical protein